MRLTRRALALAAALAALGVSVAAAATGSPSVAIAVVRCPTVFGVTGAHRQPPATVAVSASGPTHGLAAYTNTEIFLVAPRGFRCAGIVAADGGSQVTAWAPGQARPAHHSHGVGLTLNIDPACASCRADDACPFLPALARGLGFPCAAGVPAGETVVRPRADLVLFEDPPRVAGSGWPSGGPFPANGAVGTRGSPDDGSVYRATCTLPRADRALCTESLDDVITRYG